jgi:single-stranded DNA-specific DHH superfamily exonuclease
MDDKVIDFYSEKLKRAKEGVTMVKMTIKEVVEKFNTVQKLAVVEGRIPIKITYRIGKNARKMESIVKDFQNERQKLFMKYGVLDEKTKQMTIPPEKVDEFTKEIEDFVSQEIELEIMPVSIVEFHRYEKKINNQPYQISGKDMMDTEFLWEDMDKIESLPEEEKKA